LETNVGDKNLGGKAGAARPDEERKNGGRKIGICGPNIVPAVA